MRPKCPNHAVEMQKSNEPRIWICPISDARFEADSQEKESEVKYDKFGRAMQDWKVKDLGEED